MAETTIRWKVQAKLVEKVRAHAAMGNDTHVAPGWPGDIGEPNLIWLGEVYGPLTIPVAVGQDVRQQRNDVFTIPICILVRNLPDLEDVGARMAELVAAVQDVFALDPWLGDMDGVLNANVSDETTTIGQVKGAGAQGFGIVTITVKSRLD